MEIILMPKIYNVDDNGFSFKKAGQTKIYHDTNNGFDFRKSGSTGTYGPSRNSFDFKRTGQPSGYEVKRASGGAVTQAAMPAGPTASNPQMNNPRNTANLPTFNKN
jgi:hypothetical protein